MRPSGTVLFLEDFFSLLRSKVLAIPKRIGQAIRGRMMDTKSGYVLYHDRFNSLGDSLKPFRKVPPEKIEGRGVANGGKIFGQTFSEVNEFSRFAAVRGADVVFVFSAYPREEFSLNRDLIKRYERHLRTKLEIPVLGRPEDFLFPLDQFTNTVNHLTAEGKAARTKKLIRLLSGKTAFLQQTTPAVLHSGQE
jgi:hypothetical protein